MEENFAGGQRKPLEPRRRARNQQVFHASACSQYNNSRINDRLAAKTSAVAAAAKFLSRPTDEPGQFYLANHNNGLMLQSNSYIQQQQHRSCSKSNLEGGRKFDNRDGRRKKSDHYEDEQQASFPIVCLREAAGAVEMPVQSHLRHADHDRVVVVARQDSQRGSSSSNIIINSPIEPNSSNGSLKSTCDSNGSSTSSGFCSSSSAEPNTESQVRKSNWPPSDRVDYQSSCGPFGSLKHQLGLRNKVIDDLDRLLTEANKSRSRGCPSSSPTDSQLSSGRDHSPQRSLADRMFANSQDSTLTRAHEVDYSTLCRDDFSSFISPQLNENQNQPDFGQRSRMLSQQQQQQVVSEDHLIIDRCAQMDRPYGPTLIGVHENSSHPASNYSETPTSGESEEELAEEEEQEDSLVDPSEFVTQSSSSSCLSAEQSNQSDSHPATAIAESDNGQEKSIHQELSLMLEQPDENNFRSVSPLKLPTSELYATYSNRIEALLGMKLSRNETSAPPTPAARAKTPNELVRREPLPRYIVKFRDKSQEIVEITQEIEFVTEEDEADGESGLLVQRIAHGENFENIVTTPQVTPNFDWDATVVPVRQAARALTKAEAAAFEESLIECFAESHLSRENVIKIVKSHLGSFLNNYAIHQARVSQLAAGWQENWLFASKRAGDPQFSTAKRSRMDESLDLTKYSTLLNQDGSMRPKFKPPIDYLGRSALFCEPSNPASNLVGSIYGAQAERKDELKEVAAESLGQPDICRMLPNHLDEIEPNRSGLAVKPLEVFYDMSSLVRPTNNKTDKFSFSSYGYLFKCSSLPAASNIKGASRVEGLILDTFQHMLTTNNHLTRIQEQLTSEDRFESERVKFLIGLTDVELTTDLRVIQFCSKISGSLPISVRWYKLSDDGLRKWIEISSTTSSSSTRIRLREASCLRPKLSLASKSSRWPIELCASSDYEYQTEASSWFRFKRSAGDILFEIREPSHEHDLGQTYRCVLENYCSREECSFKLSRRPAGVAASSCKAKPTVAVNKVNYNGKPILRTWSQRTLHKPKPTTTNLPLELRQESRPSELVELSLRRERRRAAESQPDEGGNSSDAFGDKNANKAAACRQQSLGQRSTQMLRESSRDNFGDHFPYHPANLLKRLEANKFSTLSYRTLSKEAKVSQRETPSQHDRSHPSAAAFVPAKLESDRNDSLAANFRNSFVAIAYGEKEKGGKENDGPIASRRQLAADLVVVGQPADVNRGKLVFQRQPPPARPRLGLDS